MTQDNKGEFDVERAATVVLRAVQRHVPKQHEYREVDGREFRHVSQRYYARTTESLRTIGFRLLGDSQDKALLATAVFDPRTFERIMVDASGTTIATFCHIAPVLKWRIAMMLMRFPSTILDFSSVGEDGTIYATSNKLEKTVFPKPDWVTRQLVSRKTKPEEMYARHQQILAGVRTPLRPLRTLSDILRTKTDLRIRQRAYLEKIGWVGKDFLKLNGIPQQHVDAVYDEVQRLVRGGFVAAN